MPCAFRQGERAARPADPYCESLQLSLTQLQVRCRKQAPKSSYQPFLGSQRPSAAPVGSVIMLNCPAPFTSAMSLTSLAPKDCAFFVAALTSSTFTYGTHIEGAPGIGFFISPPPVPSPTLIIV